MRGAAATRADEDGEPEAPPAAPGAASESETAALMPPVMLGTHFHSLDEKGRVIIPAKMRPALAEHFWMMINNQDNIALYPFDTGLSILEKCELLIEADPEDEALAEAVGRITSASEYVTVETGYRVLVPEILRFRAGLEKEVVTVGHLNNAVLWSRARWEETEATRVDSDEVRRKQGAILRAASASRRGVPGRAVEAEEVLDEAATETPLERVASERGTATGRGAAAAGGRKVASAGDGRRVPDILALSKLGR